VITLYDYDLSGNCYKVRLLLSMLQIEYEKEVIEFYPAAAHKSPEFLAINPLGSLPTLTDENLTLTDSASILVYLACQYDQQARWYPQQNARVLAKVTEWLAFANELNASASVARLVEGFFYQLDADAARKHAHQLFRILDEHLWFQEQDTQQWLVAGAAPTIADIACFPYVILSEEGSISRQDYPAIRRWTDRVKRIPGFVTMPGVFPAGPARVEHSTVHGTRTQDSGLENRQ